MRVLLVCERSGGHIFPALAFGKKFRRQFNCQKSKFEAEVYFFATSSFLKKYIEREGFIVVGKSFSFRNIVLEGVWRLCEAIYLILKLRPKKVIGFGGRDSFFLIFISSLLFLDTQIYEPNVALGKTNRVLSFFVRKILRGFEVEKENGAPAGLSVPTEAAGKSKIAGRAESRPASIFGLKAQVLWRGDKKNKTIGIPLRENMKKIDKFDARKILHFNDKPVIFCFGGSQGASFINQVFVKFVQYTPGDFQIIHLTGRDEYWKIFQLYKRIINNKFIKDFYYRMEILYSAADIVVSRAGANTLGEISYFRLPSILIPNPSGGGHQKKNAFYFRERGAALVSLQEDFSFPRFRELLRNLISNSSLRQSLEDNLSKIKLGVEFEDFCNNYHF